MKEENNFLVETEGHCFFCLNKIPAPCLRSKLEPKIRIPKPSIYSLQYFSRYLKIDMTRVFSTNEPISPELLAKVEMAKLKVELCEECASQTERFSELCRQLEKIEMEIGFYVKLIHGKLVAAETEQLLGRSAKADLTGKFSGKLEIVNALRNEAAKKCDLSTGNGKLGDKMAPRIKLQNKTKRQLNLEKLKIKVRTRRNSFNNAQKFFTTSEPLDLSPDSKLEPCHSPSDSFLNDDVNNDFYQYGASDSGDFNNPAVPLAVEQKPTIISPSEIIDEVGIGTSRSRLDPKTGKYKCEICSKEFLRAGHFSRHYRAVHLKIRYRCRFCSKEFTQQDNHRRHLKKEHLGT